MRTKATKLDLLLAVLCLCFALVSFLLPLWTRKDGNTLIITDHISGQQSAYSLTTDQTIEVTSADGSHHLTVVIERGTVRVSASDCPDGVCMAGAISRAGQALVCAPAQITLAIQGDKEDHADAVVG